MVVDTGANTQNLVNSYENPTYQCSKSRLNTITLDFQNEGSTGACAGLTTQKWSMLIQFNH